MTVILSQLGFDPLALFLSLSGVILAFGFIIGSASAKYFEGLLFILIRRPYGIGDKIHISNVENDTDFYGSAGWVSHVVSSRGSCFGSGKTNCMLTYALLLHRLGCRKHHVIRDDCHVGTNEREMQFVERLLGKQSHHQRCALSASPDPYPSDDPHRYALREDSRLQDCNRRVYERASPRVALLKWLSCL
jgi:hypothetical protein